MQACTKCQVIKPFSGYYAAKGYATGYQRICKTCNIACKQARYFANHKENKAICAARAVAVYPMHREKILAAVLAKRLADPEAARAAERLSRKKLKEKDPQRLIAKAKAQYAKNTAYYTEKNLKYRTNNKQAIRDYQREYSRKYYTIPERKLAHTVSVLMNRMLRNGKEGRSWRTYVDYSLEDLVAHLEKQFTEGMTWGNYGKWHVDHIIARAALPCVNPADENFKQCWAIENLQPLWAADNIRKGSRPLLIL